MGDTAVLKFTTLADFVDTTSNQLAGFAFRGQSDGRWRLVPAIDRASTLGARANENALLDAFKAATRPLLRAVPANDWDWLALAHYSGIPTRLMDWSRNPLVALFFAVSRESDSDSVVWAYRHDGRMRIPRTHPFRTKRLILFETTLSLLVRVARYGIYTAHPLGTDLHSSGALVQIQVPRRARLRILEALAGIGISHQTLFPGIPDSLLQRLASDVRVDLRTPRRAARELNQLQRRGESRVSRFAFDVFVSYASEDGDFTTDVVERLRKRGLRVWFDRTEVRVGDSLTATLDRGLTKSRYAVVVVSDAYIRKHWTQHELRGLLQREADEGQIILPIWLNISGARVKKFSVTFSDKVALRAPQLSTAEIARELATVIRAARPT